jgi:hypothetical protein
MYDHRLILLNYTKFILIKQIINKSTKHGSKSQNSQSSAASIK